MYYKALHDNMSAMGGFQYEIGKVAVAETDDSRCWLYFTPELSRTMPFGNHFYEVEPVSEINYRNANFFMNAKKIRIIRELPREGIFQKLSEEGYPIRRMWKLQPTYEELLRMKDRIKYADREAICDDFEWLSEEEKIALLPKCWRRRVERHGDFKRAQE